MGGFGEADSDDRIVCNAGRARARERGELPELCRRERDHFHVLTEQHHGVGRNSDRRGAQAEKTAEIHHDQDPTIAIPNNTANAAENILTQPQRALRDRCLPSHRAAECECQAGEQVTAMTTDDGAIVLVGGRAWSITPTTERFPRPGAYLWISCTPCTRHGGTQNIQPALRGIIDLISGELTLSPPSNESARFVSNSANLRHAGIV